jgi:nucleotide-binding universal stress UspA family protein
MIEATPRRKILVALDGSPAAATALPTARALAAQLDATLEILHIASEEAPTDDLWSRLHAGLIGSEAVQIRSHAGEPAAVILEAVSDPAVILVVLTTHGRDVEPGRPLSHVAEAVAATADRPVVLVRPEAATASDAAVGPFRRLLVPLDGTPTTAAALPPVTTLAARLGVEIDLLYVAGLDGPAPGEPGSMGAPRYVDQPQHEWAGWKSEVVQRFGTYLAQCPTDVHQQMYLAHGDVATEVIAFAIKHRCDGIALVRRSRLEAGRGLVLRAILDRTPCPVLLLGAPFEAAPAGPTRGEG